MSADVHTPKIVVGVDGSESSITALSWAINQAHVTGAEVFAVQAWHGDLGSTFGGGLTVRDDADKSLTHAVNTVAHPDVIVHTMLREGTGAGVLIEASQGADLLVVGTRGRGGFAGLLLGSVSTQCMHHATCPVVVVRTPPATQESTLAA